MSTGRGPTGRRVEHHEVGVPALGDAPAPAQPVEPGGHVGEQVDGLLEREQLALAHRCAEQRGACS